jgi:hypothetical protein
MVRPPIVVKEDMLRDSTNLIDPGGEFVITVMHFTITTQSPYLSQELVAKLLGRNTDLPF